MSNKVSSYMRIPNKRQLRASLSAGALITIFAIGLTGCSHGRPIRAKLQADVERPKLGAVIFLCDGFDPDYVAAGCREGWLPNIKKRIVDEGTHVRNAISCMPAVTYPALTTMMTGTSPADHGIAGVWWFDRHERRFRDYATVQHYRSVNNDFDLPTLYERLAPAPTVNVQTAVTRGVTKNFANWVGSGVRWAFSEWTGVDKLTASTLRNVIAWSNRTRAWPVVLTLYFPGVDAVAYDHGVSSDEYRDACEHLDHQIGRVCNWLEREDLLDTTLLVLVSDHGMIDIDENVDLMPTIHSWGRRATDKIKQNGSLAQRARFYDQFDTVVQYQSGRHARLYFAGPDGWDDKPAPNEVAQILEAPPAEQRMWNHRSVHLVAYAASDTETIMRTADGVSRIIERDGPTGREFRYDPGQDDVLGYLEDQRLAAFVNEGFHDRRAWLMATADHEFPDVVPLLGPAVHASRGGQALVFPKAEFGFTNNLAGHGGLYRDEMCSTLYMAGPGIEPGSEIDACRLEDLTPTLLARLAPEPQSDTIITGIPLLGPEGPGRAAGR